MGATLDKFMTIEEVPEEWRSLDVTVGGPVDASNFCDNGVRTYKYNLLNFFPKSMFEQMRRTANQYFLLICIMMFLGTYTTWFYSPLTPWSTFLPLMIILLVTMAKEGFEDVKRHQSDKRVNNTPATILSTDPGDAPGITQTLRRKDLRPGHVVVIGDREEIPADLILLWSSEGPQAYVETSNIDGETNLKIKKPALIDDEPIIASPETAKNTQLSSTFEPPCGGFAFEELGQRAVHSLRCDAVFAAWEYFEKHEESPWCGRLHRQGHAFGQKLARRPVETLRARASSEHDGLLHPVRHDHHYHNFDDCLCGVVFWT